VSATPIRRLSPKQVADLAGVSVRAVYRAIEDGQLDAYRVRSRLRVREDDCEAWLDSDPVRPTQRPTPPPVSPGRGQAGSLRALLASEEGRAA